MVYCTKDRKNNRISIICHRNRVHPPHFFGINGKFLNFKSQIMVSTDMSMILCHGTLWVLGHSSLWVFILMGPQSFFLIETLPLLWIPATIVTTYIIKCQISVHSPFFQKVENSKLTYDLSNNL